MEKKYFFLLVLLSFMDYTSFAQVQDIEGNTYKTVVIGNQEWMAENLRTTKFSNGDSIANVINATDFYYYGKPAWAYYANNSDNDTIYGKLYNGLTAVDERNCCPDGWHVPTDADWTILVNYMGGEDVAGTKLKNSTAWNGTDEVGFNAMPGGLRYALAGDLNEGTLYGQGFWWSSEYSDNTRIFFYRTETFTPNFYRSAEQFLLGMSVRCIKNTSVGVNENSIDINESFLYPNPFSSKATLVINNNFEGDVTLKIFNATGQLIKEINEYANSSITIDRGGLPEGLYHYSVNADNDRISSGKFIIKD